MRKLWLRTRVASQEGLTTLPPVIGEAACLTRVAKQAKPFDVDENVDTGAFNFYAAQYASTCSRHLLETECVENRQFHGHAGIRLGHRRSYL